MPAGTSDSRKSGTLCASAAPPQPIAASSRPSTNARRSPSLPTTRGTSPTWTSTPRTPKRLSTYPVCGTSKSKRRAQKSANVPWKTANADQ